MMPTLDELVDGAYRDLADEAKVVFSQLQVEDFVRGGIVELNRVAPNDVVEDVAFVTDPDTGQITQFEYDIAIRLPYSVEIESLVDGGSTPIAQAEMGQTPMSGWVFRETPAGGHIEFGPPWLRQVDPAYYVIHVRGYATRPLPYNVEGDPSPEVPVSDEEAYAIREFAKAQGYDLLQHDRSLFAQWQGQTNNTDVSPVMMLNMAAQAKSDWERKARRISVTRRYW